MDHFEKLDPDLHQSEKPDPYPHQSEKEGAMEAFKETMKAHPGPLRLTMEPCMLYLAPWKVRSVGQCCR